jgi:hypothetical protein
MPPPFHGLGTRSHRRALRVTTTIVVVASGVRTTAAHAGITFAPLAQPSTLPLIAAGFCWLIAASYLGSGLRGAVPRELADKV